MEQREDAIKQVRKLAQLLGADFPETELKINISQTISGLNIIAKGDLTINNVRLIDIVETTGNPSVVTTLSERLCEKALDMILKSGISAMIQKETEK